MFDTEIGMEQLSCAWFSYRNQISYYQIIISQYKLEDKDPVRQKGSTLVIPGVSLSKLQLQSVVDLILTVRISHMQNIFTWQREKCQHRYLDKQPLCRRGNQDNNYGKGRI